MARQRSSVLFRMACDGNTGAIGHRQQSNVNVTIAVKQEMSFGIWQAENWSGRLIVKWAMAENYESSGGRIRKALGLVASAERCGPCRLV